jgi:hypothetical protein
MNVGMVEKHVFEHIKCIVHMWDVFFWMELCFKAIPHRFPYGNELGTTLY